LLPLGEAQAELLKSLMLFAQDQQMLSGLGDRATIPGLTHPLGIATAR
jgi:hypothetical protein